MPSATEREGDAMTVLDALRSARVLPVLTLYSVEDALPVAQALFDGGVRAVEITLRSPTALACLERITRETELLVGAGTVLSPDDVSRVAEAGADFVVSPGFDADVVRTAQEAALAVIPGVATPTEVQRALRAGVRHVKVFPAQTLGGPTYLRQLRQPFPDLGLLPSGGITLDAAADYLAVPGVLAVSGSWMVPAHAIAAGDYAKVTRLTVETFERIKR